MRPTHYFQRFSQKENVVTNNTLLLLQRLHEFNPRIFENVINILLNAQSEGVSIGPRFNQQIGGGSSVADGEISQQGITIHIETKLHSGFSVNQLINHAKGLKSKHGRKILIGLSQNVMPIDQSKNIKTSIKSSVDDTIDFISISYSDLIQSIRDELRETDYEFQDILLDYEMFCQEEHLIDYTPYVMMAVAVGVSHHHNLKYKLYYDPRDRNHRGFTYLGLYRNKKIDHIGKLSKIVNADLVNGDLIVLNDEVLTKQEKQNILDCMNNSIHSVKQNHTFYIVDEFCPVNYPKQSGHIVSKKYIYYSEDNPEGFKIGMNAKDLAVIINGKVW